MNAVIFLFASLFLARPLRCWAQELLRIVIFASFLSMLSCVIDTLIDVVL
jgi:hypothetical protein